MNWRHKPSASLSLPNRNLFLQGKKWIWGRIHRSPQQSPTWPFMDVLSSLLAGDGPRASVLPGHSRGPGEKPSVGLTWKVWSEAAGLWTVSTPSPKGQTGCIYKSRTSHIHTNNQMKVERPSLLKAVTVMQEYKLPGQLQSVCPTMPQNQRVRSQWEDCFRKNRAAPVSELACG